MNQLIKNFIKLDFFKIFQTLIFTFFIILFVALSAGIVAMPLQLLPVSNNVMKNSRPCDYQWTIDWPRYSFKFGYEYFENQDGELYNEWKEPLLKLDYQQKPHGPTLDEELQLYYQNHQEKASSYEEFLGKFIIDDVMHFRYLYDDHKVLIPSDSPIPKTYYFKNIVNDFWVQKAYASYGQVYRWINPDLARKFKLSMEIQLTFNTHFDWSDAQHPLRRYNTYGIHENMLDQVVLDPRQHFNLHTMKDNEVLLNAAYAQEVNLKVGDWIEVNNFTYKDGRQPPFNHKYQIVGFALKPHDLFSPNMFGQKEAPEVNLYITDAEEEKYTRFLYETDNVVFNPLKSTDDKDKEIAITYVTTRVKELVPGANEKFFEKLVEYQVLKHDPEVKKFTQLDAYLVYTIFKIISLVLIAISLLILTLSVLFISYSLSKEIEMYKQQIFILKAMGYRSSSLAFIWWLRTLGILLVGFWLGWLLSFGVQYLTNQMMAVDTNFVIHPLWFNPIFLMMVLLILPVGLSLVNYFYLWKLISHKNLTNMDERRETFVKNPRHYHFHNAKWKVHQTAGRVRYFDKLATVKKPMKTFFIFILSLLFELMIFFEFGTKRFINATVDQVNPIYNQSIEASFRMDEVVSWAVEDAQFVATNWENFDLKTLNYQDETEFQRLINNPQTQALNSLIEKYLTVNRQASKNLVRSQIIFDLYQLTKLDFNHVTIKIETLQKWLQVMETDYQTLFKNEAFEPTHKKVQTLIEPIQTQFKNLANSEMYYTINNVFLQKDVDYPVLDLKLFNLNYQWISSRRWKLIMLDENNASVFNQDLTSLANQKIEQQVVPVIASKHFALINHYQIGDVIKDIPINRVSDNDTVDLKICAINEDTVSNNFYALSSAWNAVSNLPNFYNEVYTKRPVINQDLKITTNYLNGLYRLNDNQKLSLWDLFDQQPVSFLSPKSFASGNFQSYMMLRQQTTKKTQKFRNLLDTITIISILLILILFVVYVMVNINNNLDDIYTLRAIGYRSDEVNNYVNANYLLILFVSILLTGLITFEIWKLVTKIITNSGADLVVNNPFSFLDLSITFIVIGSILGLGYLESYLAVKNILATTARG